MTYEMTERSYLNLAGNRTRDYTTMVVIVLNNITRRDECLVELPENIMNHFVSLVFYFLDLPSPVVERLLIKIIVML